MSTVPRVSSAIPGEAAHFQTVLAHQPVLATRFGDLYGALWGSDVLSARIKEICRMRNARITACGFCRQVRFAKPRDAGLDETVIDEVTDDYAKSARLSAPEKAALRFTDALIFDPELFDGNARAELHRHFTPPQIAELTLAVMLFLALAKVLITLGLEPESLDTTIIPTPAAAPLSSDTTKLSANFGPPLETVLAERPELLKGFARFLGALRDEHLLEPALYDRLRGQMASAHGFEPQLSPSGYATERERTLLAYAEKIPFAHHAITDDESATVRAILGDADYVTFSVAAALFDAVCRAQRVHEQPAAQLILQPSQPTMAATIA